MKKLVSLALLVGLSACGGSGDTLLSADGVADEATAPVEGQAPLMKPFATLNWKKETISFFNMSSPEELPTILVEQQGPIVDGDILQQMEAQTSYAVTPAELWNTVSQEEIPDILLENHAAIVARDGRPNEFIKFDPTLVVPNQPITGYTPATAQDQASNAYVTQDDLNNMFNLTRYAGSCWAGAKTQTTFFQAINYISAFVCTSHSPVLDQSSTFIRTGDISTTNACPSSLASIDTVRAAVLNSGSSGLSITAQGCGYVDHGFWSCDQAQTVPPGQFRTIDQASLGIFQEIGIGAKMASGPFAFAASPTFGAARLVSGPPQFGKRTCGIN